MQTPDIHSKDNQMNWESSMQQASDALRVQPKQESWQTLSKQLDEHKKAGGASVIQLYGKYILRIAAVLLIGFGVWWTVAKQNQAEPLMSEWITDSPAYFASYLDVAQSLEGHKAVLEGTGHADFREGFPGMPTMEDTVGKL